MKGKGQENIVVQSLVERPHVHILGRCGSSEVEELSYINTRKACLQTLDAKVLTSGGIQITDIMQFFHRWPPSNNMRLGNRKVGMLNVPVAVAMPDGTRILQFPSAGHT